MRNSGEKPEGSWMVGMLGAITGPCRTLRSHRQALPTPERHKHGIGETISNNVLNSEDQLHWCNSLFQLSKDPVWRRITISLKDPNTARGPDTTLKMPAPHVYCSIMHNS